MCSVSAGTMITMISGITSNNESYGYNTSDDEYIVLIIGTVIKTYSNNPKAYCFGQQSFACASAAYLLSSVFLLYHIWHHLLLLLPQVREALLVLQQHNCLTIELPPEIDVEGEHYPPPLITPPPLSVYHSGSVVIMKGSWLGGNTVLLTIVTVYIEAHNHRDVSPLIPCPLQAMRRWSLPTSSNKQAWCTLSAMTWW